MRSPVRPRVVPTAPGIEGPARVDRRVRSLLPRLRPGDIAVFDHLDLDRATAQALVDAEVRAVVDVSAMISGRYANLGPATLVAAGIAVVDCAGAEVLTAVRDGRPVRLDGATIYVGEVEVAQGRVLDEAAVAAEMEQARTGLVTQLESLTHTSSVFLRREQDLLLHGVGVPRLGTRVAGRPVVVVTGGPDAAADLAAARDFAREQHPVLIGVGTGAETLRSAGLRPDVVVLDATADDHDLPRAATLKGAHDVVVRVDPGAAGAVLERYERLGLRPVVIETGAAPEDAALVIADAAEASVVVTAGMRASIEDLLDSRRPGLAGAYLTRLKLGPRLVDARAVPQLYSGRVRPWHLLLVLLAGLVALAAAVAVTPVGQEWLDQLQDVVPRMPGALSQFSTDLYDTVSGLFT